MRNSMDYEAFTSGHFLIEQKSKRGDHSVARADRSKNLLHGIGTAQENKTVDNDQKTEGN